MKKIPFGRGNKVFIASSLSLSPPGIGKGWKASRSVRNGTFIPFQLVLIAGVWFLLKLIATLRKVSERVYKSILSGRLFYFEKTSKSRASIYSRHNFFYHASSFHEVYFDSRRNKKIKDGAIVKFIHAISTMNHLIVSTWRRPVDAHDLHLCMLKFAINPIVWNSKYTWRVSTERGWSLDRL